MKVREEIFTVKSYECRPDGNIKTACLMQYLQEAAALHAEELGFGVDGLNTINSYWVLSNLRIEINRIPKWNDEITVKTWPSGYNRLIATREFVARDQNDCELFRASSQWMVLDKGSNRPKNLFHLDLSLSKTGLKALSEKLVRLEPQDNYSEVDRISVPYSSIDLNGHVNNTEYVRWGIDALRKAFKFEGNIRSMHATYLSEVFEADELDLLLSYTKNEYFYVLAKRSDGQNNVHVMEIGC
ncbi:MAG: acyl-ACP thioesterase [Planctomycetes bacterium]|nr:acyl-ACP thioesterase [Planctomycetota bacterium]